MDTRLTPDARQALGTAPLADVYTSAGFTVAVGPSRAPAALKGITALRTADTEPSASRRHPAHLRVHRLVRHPGRRAQRRRRGPETLGRPADRFGLRTRHGGVRG